MSKSIVVEPLPTPTSLLPASRPLSISQLRFSTIGKPPSLLARLGLSDTQEQELEEGDRIPPIGPSLRDPPLRLSAIMGNQPSAMDVDGPAPTVNGVQREPNGLPSSSPLSVATRARTSTDSSQTQTGPSRTPSSNPTYPATLSGAPSRPPHAPGDVRRLSSASLAAPAPSHSPALEGPSLSLLPHAPTPSDIIAALGELSAEWDAIRASREQYLASAEELRWRNNEALRAMQRAGEQADVALGQAEAMFARAEQFKAQEERLVKALIEAEEARREGGSDAEEHRRAEEMEAREAQARREWEEKERQAAETKKRQQEEEARQAAETKKRQQEDEAQAAETKKKHQEEEARKLEEQARMKEQAELDRRAEQSRQDKEAAAKKRKEAEEHEARLKEEAAQRIQAEEHEARLKQMLEKKAAVHAQRMAAQAEEARRIQAQRAEAKADKAKTPSLPTPSSARAVSGGVPPSKASTPGAPQPPKAPQFFGPIKQEDPEPASLFAGASAAKKEHISPPPLASMANGAPTARKASDPTAAPQMSVSTSAPSMAPQQQQNGQTAAATVNSHMSTSQSHGYLNGSTETAGSTANGRRAPAVPKTTGNTPTGPKTARKPPADALPTQPSLSPPSAPEAPSTWASRPPAVDQAPPAAASYYDRDRDYASNGWATDQDDHRRVPSRAETPPRPASRHEWDHYSPPSPNRPIAGRVRSPPMYPPPSREEYRAPLVTSTYRPDPSGYLYREDDVEVGHKRPRPEYDSYRPGPSEQQPRRLRLDPEPPHERRRPRTPSPSPPPRHRYERYPPAERAWDDERYQPAVSDLSQRIQDEPEPARDFDNAREREQPGPVLLNRIGSPSRSPPSLEARMRRGSAPAPRGRGAPNRGTRGGPRGGGRGLDKRIH